MPANAIIRTKLFRPTVADDIVARPRLFRKLEKGSKGRLTLVSASAGSGKSILVSSWLESCGRPNGWLSLDDEIDGLATFLRYFLSAVRRIFPEACPDTWALLDLPDTRSPDVAATELVNELSAIKTPFVLVLDDYGYVHDSDIHEVLNQVLKHSPPALHLVVLTRRDPPFPLHSFRAGGDLVEIRQKDLQFTIPETAAFLEKAVGLPIDESALEYLHERTEGWAVGLRLVALSLDNRDDVNAFLREMKGDARHVQDYLLTEVLSRQSPAMRDGLLKTSILDRFCAPLCRALCHPSCEDLCGPECDGQVFIKKLEESNLFCIALDEDHQWLRYHHLFQQLLQRTLQSRYSAEEIAALHDRARAWFEENGMIEEAFHHALAGSGSEAAGTVVARHRHELMNKEQWRRLGRLLDMLPRDLIENDPGLLMQDAWILWNRMRISEMAKVLDRVESLLADLPAESAMAEEVRGEVDALRSVQYCLAPLCDGPRAFAHARRAMERNPPLLSSTRTTAVFMLAMLHQLNGNLDDAFEVVYEELERKESRHNVYHARLLITLCSIYWVEADLGSLTHVGRELWKISGEIGLPENRDFGQFFLGIGHYCRNEPAAAEENLKRVVNNSSMMNISIYAHSACALSLAIQAQGRSDEAGETAETVARRALNSGNIPVLKLVHALQAELALRQGNLSEAVKWAEDYHPEPFQTAHRFFVPQLTFARILLAQATAESRQQTADLLLRLHEFYQSIHNRHCLMNVLALQARLHNDLGDEPVALASLERAISMAEPGGFVRIFLDLGPDMAGLLRQLSERGVAAGYIGRLLAAFQGDEPESRPDTDIRHPAVTASNVPALPVPLTNRELEVLSLLAMRLSNKELSGKLFISAATVKRHLSNLYAKLEVHGRREVVDKATSLGILS